MQSAEESGVRFLPCASPEIERSEAKRFWLWRGLGIVGWSRHIVLRAENADLEG